jgi:hypothetical protein
MQLSLFNGEDLKQKRGRGRPAYKKTVEKQLLVKTMQSSGHTQSEIAEAIGCSLATLKRHYFSQARKVQEIDASTNGETQ